MSLASTSNGLIEILKDRARMFAAARTFFANQGLIEVDCPIVSPFASVDTHIDLFKVLSKTGQWRYLHSSPEYGMKRLLTLGIGDCYQISHVFRDEEWGSRHNPEFTMVEWYRVGMPFAQLISETLDFLALFLGPLKPKYLPYREAFKQYVGIDSFTATFAQLVETLKQHQITYEVSQDVQDNDDLLSLLWGSIVEPKLKEELAVVIVEFPASQAALAQTHRKADGALVAERFEIYCKGVELANGYHELSDAKEQQRRLELANAQRALLGKETLRPDPHFIAALRQGLPDSCGVAVGFDRLMMLRHQTHQIADVLPFAWDKA